MYKKTKYEELGRKLEDELGRGLQGQDNNDSGERETHERGGWKGVDHHEEEEKGVRVIHDGKGEGVCSRAYWKAELSFSVQMP